MNTNKQNKAISIIRQSQKLSLIILLFSYIVLAMISQAQASTRKFFHSSYLYNSESGKVLHLNLDGNMPDDIAGYKIYLTKSEDLNAPFVSFLDGGNKQFIDIRLTEHYLTVDYRYKSPYMIPEWYDLSQEEQLEALIRHDALPFCERAYLNINDPFHPQLTNNIPPKENESTSSERTIAPYINDYDDSDNTLYLKDTTDPNHVVTLSNLILDNDIKLGYRHISLQQDYLYIVTWYYSYFKKMISLYIISVKDLSNPFLVKKYSHDASHKEESFLEALSFRNRECEDIKISGHYLYIMGGQYLCYNNNISDAYLKIIDISDPLNLKRAGEGHIIAECPDSGHCFTSDFSELIVNNGYACLIREISHSSYYWSIPYYQRNIYTNYGSVLYLIDTQDIIRHCAEKQNILSSEVTTNPHGFIDSDVQPLQIIPINGSDFYEWVIKDNLIYFSLYEGGFQVVEIPAYCRNLHWLDAKTLSAEIAMPISPGLYNVVVEVTEEEAATEPSNGQSEDQTSGQTNDQTADQTNDQTSDQTADQGGQTNDQGTSSYDELAAHFQSVMGKYLLANPYDPYMQRLQSSLSTNLFTKSSHWLEKSPFLTAFFYPLQDLFSPPASSYNLPLGLIPTWCPLWLSPYLTQESLENYYFMLNNK